MAKLIKMGGEGRWGERKPVIKSDTFKSCQRKSSTFFLSTSWTSPGGVGIFVKAPWELEVPKWQFLGEAKDLHMYIVVTTPSRRDRKRQRNSKKLKCLITWCQWAKETLGKQGKVCLLMPSQVMLPGHHAPKEGNLPVDMPVLESWKQRQLLGQRNPHSFCCRLQTIDFY